MASYFFKKKPYKLYQRTDLLKAKNYNEFCKAYQMSLTDSFNDVCNVYIPEIFFKKKQPSVLHK